MIDNQTVGKTIAALRQQADLSQQALANLCNVTHQAVSKWEKGLALPDMQTMLFLSKYFGVTMEDILTGNLPVSAAMENAPMDEADEIFAMAEEAREAMPEETISAACEAEDEDAMEEAEAQTDGQEKGEIPSMDWQEILHLAPFASRATLDQLVLAQLENGDGVEWKKISALMPFVSGNVVDQLVDRTMQSSLDWQHARCILPFASRSKIEEIFSHFLKEMDTKKLVEIAPFVSGSFLAKAIREMGDTVDADLAIQRLLPFLPKEMVDELILRKMGKQPTQLAVQSGLDVAKEALKTVREALKEQKHIHVNMEGAFSFEQQAMEQEQEKIKSPRKERVLMRVARKAVEEGNEEWLEEHGEELTSEELDEIIPLAADEGLWDALTEIWEHTDGETLQKLIRKAVEQEQWDLLEEMAEHADAETVQYISRAAASAHQWDLLEELQAHLDDPSLSAAARSAAENQQWDLLEEMLDRLDQETLQFVLDAAMQDSNWDIIDAITELME